MGNCNGCFAGVLQVASILYRMEYLCNIPIHVNIRTALNKYHEAVCDAQARRRQISTMSKPQQQRGHITDSQGKSYTVYCIESFFTMYAASPNLLRSYRPPVGHHTQAPSCHHEEAPRGPVVCRPDDAAAAATCQKARPWQHAGHMQKGAHLCI